MKGTLLRLVAFRRYRVRRCADAAIRRAILISANHVATSHRLFTAGNRPPVPLEPVKMPHLCKLQRFRIGRILVFYKSELFLNSDFHMIIQTDSIRVGTRFKISELGARHCPELTGKTGTVVEVSLRTTGITVLFDGRTKPTCLHRDYISVGE